MSLTDKRKREIATLVVVFTLVLLVSALAVYFIAGRSTPRENISDTASQRDTSQVPLASPRESVEPSRPVESRDEGVGVISQLFAGGGSDAYNPKAHWLDNVANISIRLVLAALLGAALAFRPRQRIRALKQNPYVSQTQILLAIVAAALMIVVGDNAARAFGIFAAVSLVRFRTNIRDPKEITVLLISLALGLASGVGRYELALILVVFAMLVLWLLEWREPGQVFRSLAVKVVSKNVPATQRALRQVFKQHGFELELRGMQKDHEEGTPGSLVYSVDVNPSVSTDQLTEDILAIDDQNIDSIEWDQKKSHSYLYQ